MKLSNEQKGWLSLMAAVIDLAWYDVKKGNRWATEAELFLKSSWCQNWGALAEMLLTNKISSDSPRKGTEK